MACSEQSSCFNQKNGKDIVCNQKCTNYCVFSGNKDSDKITKHLCPYGRSNECAPFNNEKPNTGYDDISCQKTDKDAYTPVPYLTQCQNDIPALTNQCKDTIQHSSTDMGNFTKASCQKLGENDYVEILPKGSAFQTWPTLKFLYDGRDQKFHKPEEVGDSYDSDNYYFAYCETDKKFDREKPVPRPQFLKDKLKDQNYCFYAESGCLEGQGTNIKPVYFEIDESKVPSGDDKKKAAAERCRTICNNFYSVDGCIKDCGNYLKPQPIIFEDEKNTLRGKLKSNQCAYYQPNPYAVAPQDKATEFPKRDQWCQTNCSPDGGVNAGPICKGGFDRIMGQCYCQNTVWEQKQGFGAITNKVYSEISNTHPTCQEKIFDSQACQYDLQSFATPSLDEEGNSGLTPAGEIGGQKCPPHSDLSGNCITCLSEDDQIQAIQAFCESHS